MFNVEWCTAVWFYLNLFSGLWASQLICSVDAVACEYSQLWAFQSTINDMRLCWAMRHVSYIFWQASLLRKRQDGSIKCKKMLTRLARRLTRSCYPSGMCCGACVLAQVELVELVHEALFLPECCNIQWQQFKRWGFKHLKSLSDTTEVLRRRT